MRDEITALRVHHSKDSDTSSRSPSARRMYVGGREDACEGISFNWSDSRWNERSPSQLQKAALNLERESSPRLYEFQRGVF